MFPERARLGGYREFAPPADMRGIVAALWSYSRPEGAPPIPGDGHRLPPDTEVNLSFWTRRDARGAIVDARLILIGPVATPRFFAPEPGQHIDSVRLHPEWSRDVLGVDPRDAADAVVPFEELSSKGLPRLLRTLAASDWPLRDLMSEVRTLSAGAAASRDARLTHAALHALRGSAQATLGLGPVARALDVSERHLRRLICRTAGFNPKHLQRVARLGRAIAEADRQAHPDWAAIAGENGYFDQPHMIEDFRALVGRTPAELFRERRLQQAMAEISNPS